MMMQQPSFAGLSARKPMSAPKQQAAPSGLNVRKPISVASVPAATPQMSQNKALSGLAVRKPIDHMTMTNCLVHTINPRRALSAAALSEPATATSTSNDTFGQFDLGQLLQQAQYQPQPQYEQKPAYSVEINQQAMGLQDLSRVTQLLAYLPAVLSDPTLALELNKIQELVNLGYLQWEQALKWAQELSERAGSVNGNAQQQQQQQLPAVNINITNSTPASYSASPLHDLAYALPANANNTELQVESFVSSSYSVKVWGGYGGVYMEGSAPQATSSRPKLQLKQANSRNVRIFISSTFRDMEMEREELMKWAFPRLRKFCSDRGVFLTQVDLRWGITEDQSQAGDTINICLREVDLCRPYFVCMLGERYGWAQPDEACSDALLSKTFERAAQTFPWIANYKDRSITELEIRHALLNDSTDKAMERCLFYFRQLAQGQSTKGLDARDVKLQAKLGKLKDEIKSAGARVTQYKSPAEMALKMVEALEAAIDQDFPITDAPTPLQRERAAHDAFAASRARVYVGRGHYFDHIDKHLSTHPSKPLVICGESGSGKSALVCNWALGYVERYKTERLVITHYIGSTAQSTDLAGLLRRIMGEIKSFYGVPDEIPTDLRSLIEAFPDWLTEAAKRGGLLLVLDALNQLEDRGKGEVHDLAWLPREYPNGVQVVVSTLPGRCMNTIQQRGWHTLRVEPLNETERQALVLEYMALYGKSFTPAQLARIIKAEQCQNPLFLRTLLEEMRVFGVYEGLDAKISHYLTARTPPDLFNLVFSRLESDFETKNAGSSGKSLQGLVGDVLSLIWVSRRGLTESELLDILNIPHSLWSPLHLAMEESLVSRSGFLTFFHDYMRQAVEARYLRPQNRYNQYRMRIVSYFNRPSAVGVEKRRCEEVPYQLMSANDFGQLADCITDLEMFKLLSADEYKFDLYQYWQEATKHTSVEDRFVASLAEYEQARPAPNELAAIFNTAGQFLQDIAAFDNAEMYFKRALEISETIYQHDPWHSDVASKLDALGYLYRLRGKYALAAPLYERAMKIREKTLGPENPEFASSVNSLAILYRHQGLYDKAEPLYIRALRVRQKIFGEIHADIAQSFNSLGCLNQDMGRFKEAEDYLLRAISMRETLCGPNHPDVAMSLANLGGLYMDQSRYDEAHPHYARTLNIYESVYGPVHPSVAQTFNSMAGLAQEAGKYEEAEALYTKTLAIRERLLGDSHPELALTLNDFAVLYARQDKYDMAEPLYQRALSIRERVIGVHHPDYAQSLNNIGSLYQDMGQYTRALPLFEQALKICEAAFGPRHMDVASSLTNIAGCYQFLRRYNEAIPLYRRALEIYEDLLGPIHADVAVTTNDLAVLYFTTGNTDQAEKLYKKALHVYEKIFGPHHPDVGQALANLGEFYVSQHKRGDARQCLERAAAIYAQTFGEGHARTQAAQLALSRVA